VGKVVALKGVKLGDYGGRSISTQHSTTYDFAPDHPEAHKVRGWWDAHKGAPPALRALTERGGGGGGAGGEGPLSVLELRAPVKDLRADAGSGTDGPLKVSKVTLTSIRRDDPSKLWYPACPGLTDAGRTCNKKMTATDSGAWTCASGCMAQAPTYRYIANATLVDASGQEFCTFFDTEACQILGHPANEIQGMVAAAHGDAAGLPPDAEAIFAAVMYKELLLTTKAKLDDRGAEARVRVTVVKVREVDPAREAKVLINSLRQYAAATAAA
jgi:replication factor A1